MRINRLELAGFGPFRTVQTVDFDEFIDDGIFLITGKTGAGKSSILDAICFALYDAVPRYEGTQTRLRSHHAAPEDPSRVTLEFTVGGSRYRVTRTPEYERIKKSGTGTTTQKSTAELFVRRSDVGSAGDAAPSATDAPAAAGDALGVAPPGADAPVAGTPTSGAGGEGGWVGLASGARDVGHEISRIVALTKDQFLQVVLLAQNRFQEFLLAKNEERQAVLRSLFGTKRFEQYEAMLAERAKELETQVGVAAGQIHEEARRVVDLLAGAETAAGDDDRSGPGDHPEETRGAPGEQTVQGVELDGGGAGAGGSASEFGVSPQDPSLDWFEAALTRMGDLFTAADTAADSADRALVAAETALRALEETRSRQQRRDDAASRLDVLALEKDVIAENRLRVRQASSAAVVWPYAEARQKASAALEAALLIEAAAVKRFRAAEAATAQKSVLTVLPEVDAAAIAASIDESSRTLGALEPVVKEEAAIAELSEEVARLQAECDAAISAVTENSVRATELPHLIEQLGARVVELQLAADKTDSAEGAVRRASAAMQGAKEAARLSPELAAAHESERVGIEANATAAARLEQLFTRRLAGYAGELAAELKPGGNCAVCGSTEHPNPAVAETGSVTDADIAQARTDLERCRAVMEDTRRVTETIGARRAAAQERSGGRSVDELALHVAAAETDLSRARDAADQLITLRDELTAVKEEHAALGVEAERLRSARDETVAEFATADGRLTQVRQRVAEARQGFASAAERAEALQTALDAAQELTRAVTARDSRRETLVAAEQQLAAQLHAHGFDTEAEVAAVRLDGAQVQRLETGIADWEQAGATARATLAEPTLVDLPAVPVDTTQATVTRNRAQAARDAAFATRSTVHERHTLLLNLVSGVRVRLEASARLKEEHDQVRELAAAVQGSGSNTRRMRLETYVLAGQLEDIVAAANVRLRVMTSGRYALEHDDSLQFRGVRSGLGLEILDHHTGRSRATRSLSGGETFLASLALALGLAEVVTNQAGGLTLDTLFVDEGFGSLDADTLDVAMSTLDSLRAGGRTIGLISHVGAMKEQIPAHLKVEVGANGDSHIRSSR